MSSCRSGESSIEHHLIGVTQSFELISSDSPLVDPGRTNYIVVRMMNRRRKRKRFHRNHVQKCLTSPSTSRTVILSRSPYLAHLMEVTAPYHPVWVPTEDESVTDEVGLAASVHRLDSMPGLILYGVTSCSFDT
jgi:hypothetical protein